MTREENELCTGILRAQINQEAEAEIWWKDGSKCWSPIVNGHESPDIL